MKQYLDLLRTVRNEGVRRPNRTGIDTFGLFGAQIRIDLTKGFPLLTTKKVYWKGVLHEALWFIAGDTNVKYLQDNGVKIWNQWAGKDGELGPVYGHQWRRWSNLTYDDMGRFAHADIDQLKAVVERIKTNPECRRLIVSAWNPADIPKMALPPCHCFFQFYVQDGRLSCHLYMRSADLFLGLSFNIASYALLTHMVAHATGLKVGDLVQSFGDVHIYENHLEQVDEQLTRTPTDLPQLAFMDDAPRDLFALRASHILLMNYAPQPAIKAEVAV
jgi:thymidylate synthase